MKIVLPSDVAPIRTPNNSLFLVFIFPDEQLAWNFYIGLIKNHEIGVDILKEKDNTYSFILHSSNTPGEFYVKTGRTIENNSNIKMITNPEYSDYCYISCGYRSEQEQEVMYNQEGVPVFLNRL
jgi:hypothetical protein